MRKTPDDITTRKNADKPLVCLTAYTAPMAALLDPHCDLLLVGDSLAMVLYGMDSTRGATLPMMIAHGQAVMRTAKQTCVIVDMPYGSYEESNEQALENAQDIMRETSCSGVKLEGGVEMAPRIKTITDQDIPVVAHIGLQPQSVDTPDGYRVQGRDDIAAQKIMADAQAVSKAGAFAVVLEAVPEPLAAEITKAVPIPTIGIGASAACDGQILVTEDMLGMSLGRTPKFVKEYADLSSMIDQAVQAYAEDVRSRTFPTEENTYKGNQKKNAA